MVNRIFTLMIAVTATSLATIGYAHANYVKVAGIHEFVVNGANLRSTPAITLPQNQSNVVTTINSRKSASQLAFTGKIVKGINQATNRPQNFYELRGVGRAERFYVAVDTVSGGTQDRLSALHNMNSLKRIANNSRWACSSAVNLDLPENARVASAFAPGNFDYSQTYWTQHGEVVKRKGLGLFKSEIKISRNGTYSVRNKFGQKYEAAPMAFCSDGRYQVARILNDGQWRDIELGVARRPNLQALALQPSQNTVLVQLPTSTQGSALPGGVEPRTDMTIEAVEAIDEQQAPAVTF